MLQHLFETPSIEQVQLKRFMCYKKKRVQRDFCRVPGLDAMSNHANVYFNMLTKALN